MFQEKKSVQFVRLALAVIAGTTLMTAQAQQEPEKKDEKIQRVEITGSNIKRINTETASAVQVVSHKEILQSGATTVAEVLSNLSASTGALSDVSGSLSFAGGGTGVALRNLGKNSTLILVNGRRISPFALADGAQEQFTNVDSIPADVVERIEILKDGASAIYGSDAIAGVINIITKKEFTGLSLHATGQESLKNKRVNKNQQVSATFGFGDLAKDNYNVYAHIEGFHRNPYAERDIIQDVDPWYKKYVNPSYGVKSTYSYPGNFVDSDHGIRAPAAGCAPANIEGGLCRYDQWAGAGTSPTSDRTNFLSAGRMNLSKDVAAFAEASYSKTKTTYFNAPYIIGSGSSYTWYDSKNNTIKSYQDPLLPAGNAFNPYDFDVSLRYRFADDPSMFKNVTESSQYRVMAGLDGTWEAWDFNTALGIMGAKSEQKGRYWPHADNFINAINSGEYKFGGKNSPELLNRMFPETGIIGDSKTVFFDAKANRELMKLPGGPLSIAIGVDARRLDFNMNSSANQTNAEIVASTPIMISGSQNLAAAFMEVNAPVTKDLELNGALRVDKVSGIGASVVPKLGARYTVNSALMLRGTVAEGFRAPNVAEAGAGSSVSGFQNSLEDPKRCATGNRLFNVLNTGDDVDKALALDARDSGCSFSAAVSTNANPNLQPEKARSFTLGLVLEPSKNFNVALDYFNIERRNEITTLDVNQVIANEDKDPSAISRMAISKKDKDLAARAKELDPTATGLDFTTGSITTVRQVYANLYKTKISGIDIDADSRWDWGRVGKFKAGVEGTYLLNYAKWDAEKNAYVENLVGNYTNNRVKAVAKFSLESGPWTTGVRVNYFSGTRLITDRFDNTNSISGCADKDIPAADCEVKADIITDFSLQYTGFKNTTLMLNIRNLFDHSALLDIRANSFDLVRGRIVKLGVEYKF